MGLAVIDKNFQKEDAERHKAEEIFKEHWKRANKYKDGNVGFYGRLKIWLRLSSAPVSPPAAFNLRVDATKDTEVQDALSPLHASKDTSEHVAEIDATIGQAAAVTETDDICEFTEADISARSNWHILPDEMKVWALETSNEIDKFVREHLRKRKDIQKKKLDSSQLEMCLEDVETKIKDRRKKARATQTAMRHELDRDELSSLRDIHQDQESLSWFIMKREAELKKLEKTKQLKQERVDQMVQATRSLICGESLDAIADGASYGGGSPYALQNELALPNGETPALENGILSLENGETHALENGTLSLENGETHAD